MSRSAELIAHLFTEITEDLFYEMSESRRRTLYNGITTESFCGHRIQGDREIYFVYLRLFDKYYQTVATRDTTHSQIVGRVIEIYRD
jgi:hypothetical protein